MKKQIMKIVSVVLAACTVASVGLFGCSSKSSGASQAANTGSGGASSVAASSPNAVFDGIKGDASETYYMVTFVSGVDYWVGVYQGFKDLGKKLGVKTAYKGCTEYDINKEVSVFNQVVAMKPKGIALSPITEDAFNEPIKEAMAQGIKVVTFASDCPNSQRVAYITSDNTREGSYAADALAKAMNGKGEVCVLENPGQDNHERRVKAFINEIQTKWPDVKIVGTAATNQDPNKASTSLKTIAQAHPNLKGCFSPEASSGMGAAQAAIELNTGINVMCCDTNDSVLDMIKAGKMFGAIAPNTVAQGYLSMMSLFTSTHGLLNPMNGWNEMKKEPVAWPVLDNGLDIVTKENAQYFYLKPYLKSIGSNGVQD